VCAAQARGMAERSGWRSRTGVQAVRYRCRLGRRMVCCAGHTVESSARCLCVSVSLWLYSLVALANRRNQVLLERTLEVVLRRESPVVAGGGVVDRRRPRIDDALTLGIGLVPDPRVGERRDHDAAAPRGPRV